MSSWYKVILSVADVAGGKGMVLQKQFTTLFMAAGFPADAAMCKAKDIMLNTYFFSPGAVSVAGPLIAAYRGEACSAPVRSEVGILVAHAGGGSVRFT